MQETNILQQLTEANEQFIQLFSQFNSTQINEVPFMDSWTPAQVAQHVLKSERGMLRALQMPGKKADRDPYAKVPELQSTFLNFSIKLKSPDFIIPEQKEYNKEEQLQRLNEVSSQLATTGNEVNKEEMVSGLPLGEITKGEMIHFLAYHTQRHIHQLQRILETVNNKTKSMEATHEVVVRKVNDAFRNNDMPLFLSFCTDDIIWNMVGNGITKGKEAILQMMCASTAECPDIAIEVIFSQGDRTACTGTFSMQNKEGVKEHYSFCDVYQFNNEKIKALDSYVVPVKQ